jgi:outer membrane protein assembly factor BamB
MKSALGTLLLAAVVAFGVTACGSGGGQSCSNKDGTVLAETAWPKFRRDLSNTGRIGVETTGHADGGRRLFPRPGERIGSIATTPILAADRIILASTDSNVYILDASGAMLLDQPIDTPGAITATPLLGADGTLFVASGDGNLRQYRPDGTIRRQSSLGGFLTASPTLANQGTVYQGSSSGSFAAVCANGVARFFLGVAPMRSAPAITPDPEGKDPEDSLIVFATDTGQVRAVDFKGRERWTLFGSGPIATAVLVDEATGRFFVVNQAGRVVAAGLDGGSPDQAFRFATNANVSASLALGRDDAATPVLYVADDGGLLYAVDRADGSVRWVFRAGGSIRSSPAVATGGENDVVVFGADDGLVYAVEDGGDEPLLLWTFDTGAPVGSASPSIGNDGTVYIGNEDGVLHAIGSS